MFTVEKDIPIPKARHLNRSPIYNNWDDMNPGDSFFTPISEKATKSSRKTKRSDPIYRARQNKRAAVHNAFIRWRDEDTSRAHYKIVTRMWTENDVSGLRVWLMEK